MDEAEIRLGLRTNPVASGTASDRAGSPASVGDRSSAEPQESEKSAGLSQAKETSPEPPAPSPNCMCVLSYMQNLADLLAVLARWGTHIRSVITRCFASIHGFLRKLVPNRGRKATEAHSAATS